MFCREFADAVGRVLALAGRCLHATLTLSPSPHPGRHPCEPFSPRGGCSHVMRCVSGRALRKPAQVCITCPSSFLAIFQSSPSPTLTT